MIFWYPPPPHPPPPKREKIDPLKRTEITLKIILWNKIKKFKRLSNLFYRVLTTYEILCPVDGKKRNESSTIKSLKPSETDHHRQKLPPIFCVRKCFDWQRNQCRSSRVNKTQTTKCKLSKSYIIFTPWGYCWRDAFC